MSHLRFQAFYSQRLLCCRKKSVNVQFTSNLTEEKELPTLHFLGDCFRLGFKLTSCRFIQSEMSG